MASFYSERGAAVIDLSHDQDSTDLQKCIVHITERPKPDGAAEPMILAAGVRDAVPCTLVALAPSPSHVPQPKPPSRRS